MLYHEGALYSPRKRAFSMGQHCLIRTRLVILLGAVVACSANQCNGGMSKCVKDAQRMFVSSGFPGSKAELDSTCTKFDLGMKCLRDFSEACLKTDQIQVLESSLYGVTKTMHLLCKNTEFQMEYLKEARCYKMLSNDWELCTTEMGERLQSEVTNNTSKEESMDQMCSATTLFLRCTEDIALQKCSESASKFLLKIAKTLFGTVLREDCMKSTNTSKPTQFAVSDEEKDFHSFKTMEPQFTKSYPQFSENKTIDAKYGNHSLSRNGFPSPHSSSANNFGAGLLFLLVLLFPALYIT